MTFICDRTGVSEMYALNVDSGTLLLVTETRYGITDPVFGPDSLYYSSLAKSDKPETYRQGRMIYSTAIKDLPMREVSFSDIHRYPIADALSEQEMALAGNSMKEEYPEISFTTPRRHRKLTPVIHSWAPLYFNYDNVEETSGDEYYKTSSLGATVMFQNLVGDGYGFVGYGAHKDDGWHHSAHFKYVYEGLIPVLEISADIGDRDAVEIQRIRQDNRPGWISVYNSKSKRNDPYLEGFLRAYIPINLSSGGITRGIVPQVKYKFTNDKFDDRIGLREVDLGKGDGEPKDMGYLGDGNYSNLGTFDISVRGYVMREKPSALTYPRLGIGAEIGFHARPGHRNAFSDMAYIYTYGYLPGILQNQSIRLTATAGTELGKGDFSYPDCPVSFIPRGFTDTNIKSIANFFSPTRYKLSFDYSIPLLNLDWSGISPLAYIKNLELVPFLDYSYQKFSTFNDLRSKPAKGGPESLCSAGVDLVFNLGNFLWLPYDTSFGLRFAYNSWTDNMNLPVSGLSHQYFGFIFDVAM